jgi:hypothetical protein
MRRVITALFVINLILIAGAGYFWHLYIKEKERQQVEVVTRYVTNTVKRVVLRNPEIPFPTNLFTLFRRWQDLEANEYPKFIENLKAFGCPEDVIKDIIITDVARLYKAKRDAILAKNPPKYYQGGGYSGEVKKQLEKLKLEQKALIKDLLGVDYDSEVEKLLFKDEETEPDLFLDFLSQEKQQKVRQIIDQYKSRLQAVEERCKGIYLKEDYRELKEIEEQRDRALAEILTPEEFNEYNLRNSELAADLRNNLRDVNLTEDEFRKIYQARVELEKRIKLAAESAGAANMEDPYKKYYDDLKSILGNERYKKFEMSQSPDYYYLAKFGERFNLPEASVEKLYDFKQALQQEINNINANKNLTLEMRESIAAALVKESEKMLKGIIGEEVYNAYVEYDDDYKLMFERLVAPPELEREEKPQQTAVSTNALFPPPFTWMPTPLPPPPPSPAPFPTR